MDARKWFFLRALLALVLVLPAPVTAVAQFHGRGPANARSQNFMVSTVDQEFAEQLLNQAEKSRKELAIEWTGQELPPAREPILLRAFDVGPRVLASGVTEFGFRGKTPHSFQMVVAGSKERILDSVLPHEVLHTVFATYFGRPVIRWADEGCCTTVEHAAERTKQDKLLIEFLHTDRGIAFNKMFRMTNYPRDMLPLYSQGYSLCRYLIAQGGKRKFMDYLAKGMSTERWDEVTRECYGYQDLSDLQVTWVDWVRNGSPDNVTAKNANGVGEESMTIADARPTRPTPKTGAPAAADVAVAGSFYEKQSQHSPTQNLAKPIAGRTVTAGNAGVRDRPQYNTAARPHEPQKLQQRELSWGEGSVARPAPPTKSVPSATSTREYESPDYHKAIQSASSWSRPSATKLR